MSPLAQLPAFLASKAGRNFILLTLLSALVSAAVGVGSYLTNLTWFETDKGAEKITALELVDAFVSEYSRALSGVAGKAAAPVPATFRAHAIERFNGMRSSGNAVRLSMVGPRGREIAIPPADDDVEAAIERFMKSADPKPETRFVTIGGNLLFRTIYPSIASQQSCVDCHNRHQPDKTQWRLNDVMGALTIDAPASAFRHHNTLLSAGIAGLIFVVISGIGLFIFAMQFREFRLRDESERSLRVAAGEIEQLNQSLERRVDERTAELRAVQEELLRKERLSVLGQLTATVAHELRNPLSALRNSVFTVKEIVNQKGLTLERPITRMERSITRCDRIIGDLLDFTRMRELQRTPIAFDQWLSELLDEQERPPHVEIVRELRVGNGRASIDPDRLRRVVINLIDNAFQAIGDPQPGRAAKVAVATAIVDGGIEVVVADTGRGIPPDVLPRVFEPLFSTKNFGTGLGLPTVKQIVELHHGSIRIESELSQGTRVIIRLPLGEIEELAA
jgi:signal transduction histidine kinase